jgi:hypothetical protein
MEEQAQADESAEPSSEGESMNDQRKQHTQRMSAELYESIEERADSMGMTMTGAINMFLREGVQSWDERMKY